jgi:hypothetical protein
MKLYTHSLLHALKEGEATPQGWSFARTAHRIHLYFRHEDMIAHVSFAPGEGPEEWVAEESVIAWPNQICPKCSGAGRLSVTWPAEEK